MTKQAITGAGTAGNWSWSSSVSRVIAPGNGTTRLARSADHDPECQGRHGRSRSLGVRCEERYAAEASQNGRSDMSGGNFRIRVLPRTTLPHSTKNRLPFKMFVRLIQRMNSMNWVVLCACGTTELQTAKCVGMRW
jgi:hypothetical protein